ncbi:WAP four-disulfide core domain protein 5-like [Coturnix japonica]|uniref:WAP four-disulfide core domain protein 5-like n=1 Tax=Coturnix japonica TaxID=93934 RepID=UPI000776FC66|nr:WAP four-disulfide core domain protein 5-like [Coturnix japonica]
MESGPLLLLLLLVAAPLGRGLAESEEAQSEETVQAENSSERSAKEVLCPRTDPDLKASCLNKCREDGSCGGSRRCCLIKCRFLCVQPVPAKPDTSPEKIPHTIGCCNSTHSSDTNCPKHRRCSPPLRRFLGIGDTIRNNWGCHLDLERGPCKKYNCCRNYSSGSRSCQTQIVGCWKNFKHFRTMQECQQACKHGLHKR